MIKRLSSSMTIVLFVITILFTTSCQIGEDNDMDFTYPLETGRTWTYHRDFIKTNFDSDSLEQIYGDTLLEDMTCEVIGPVTLNDTINVIGLQSATTTIYYREDNHGLYEIAYRMGSDGLAFPKMSSHKNIMLNGLYFNNLEELSQILQQNIPLAKVSGDTLHFNDTPSTVLEYPLTRTNSWTYNTSDNPLGINKQIIRIKNITVDAGTFRCYHIKWRYDIDHDGIRDNNVWIDDYISEEGLVKRAITFQEINCFDDYGQPLGTCDSYDYYELTSYVK